MAKNKLPVASTSEVSEKMKSKAYEASERKYRAEDALRTIEKAEQHKSDKGLMRDVKGLAREKIKCLGKIK